MSESGLARRIIKLTDAKSKPVDPEVQVLRAHLDSRLLGLRVSRYSWWTHWRDVARYFLPRRYQWLVTPNKGNRGSPINQNITDTTPVVALRILSSGMMSGITSPSRQWFKLSTGDDALDELEDVKAFLDECQRRMMRVMSESNYYNAKAVQYQDLSCFGTAPLIIDEDFEDVIRCYNPAAGEYYVDNSDRLQVDIFYREFTLTCKQIADKFGLENCSADIKGAIRTGGASLTLEKVVCHAIEPNDQYTAGAPGVKGKKYREVYWEWGSGTSLVLKIKSYDEFPGSCPRWDIVSNDAYGRSPCMDALGDVIQLNVMTRRKAQGIDKMVNPPLIADSQLKNEPASTLPGAITYLQGMQNGVGFKPIYEVKPDLQYMVADIKDVQQRVRNTLYNDLFMMISQLDTVRTATEIDARREEKLIQLGPVLERFQSESLSPEINRIFNIMLRGRILPAIPPSLSGVHLKVEYVSMLAEAQKAVSTAGIERLMAFVGNIVGVKPESLDNIDIDATIDEYAELLGVRHELVVPIKKVMQMRAARAQEVQAQKMAQMAPAAAQGAQAAQTLSQTQVGGGASALDLMLGNQATPRIQ